MGKGAGRRRFDPVQQRAKGGALLQIVIGLPVLTRAKALQRRVHVRQRGRDIAIERFEFLRLQIALPHEGGKSCISSGFSNALCVTAWSRSDTP